MAVHVERRGDVALITIDRPDRRNAVDPETLRAIEQGISESVEQDARAIVITGAGGHFCAGADLTGLEDAGFATVLRSTLDLLATVPVATIAAVDGAALGAGTQLASFCDLRVATPAARFGIPAAKLGLMVDAETVQRVVALAGAGTARAMLLAADEVDGARAYQIGFVQRLGNLDDALAWATGIAKLAPLTIAGHKVTLHRLVAVPERDDVISAAFARAWASDDLLEGRAAFRERRQPDFKGR